MAQWISIEEAAAKYGFETEIYLGLDRDARNHCGLRKAGHRHHQ